MSRWRLRVRTAAFEFRRGAVRSFLFRSLSAVYQALRLDRCFLRVHLFVIEGSLPPAPHSSYALTVEELDRSQVDEYCVYRPDTDRADIVRRIDRGERCFVGRHDGRIVGDAWWVAGDVYVSPLHRTLELGRDAIWAKHSFAIPEVRGRNVDTLRGVLTMQQLWAEGYQRCYFCVWPHNRSALGSATKWGARRLGTIGCLRLGPLRIDFERLSGQPHRHARCRTRSEGRLNLARG